jgi:hypothetical protein
MKELDEYQSVRGILHSRPSFASQFAPKNWGHDILVWDMSVLGPRKIFSYVGGNGAIRVLQLAIGSKFQFDEHIDTYGCLESGND